MKPIDYVIQDKDNKICKYCIKEMLFTGGSSYLWNGVCYCSANSKFSKCSEPCTLDDYQRCPLNNEVNK